MLTRPGPDWRLKENGRIRRKTHKSCLHAHSGQEDVAQALRDIVGDNGGGLGKGDQVTLYVDGKKVGEGSVPMTQAMVFSGDDGCDVGEDSGAPVSPDYGS